MSLNAVPPELLPRQTRAHHKYNRGDTPKGQRAGGADDPSDEGRLIRAQSVPRLAIPLTSIPGNVVALSPRDLAPDPHLV